MQATALQERKEQVKPALKKELGLWSLVGLGVGGVIGSGVFALPSIMGSVAGPSFLLAVILVGLIATLIAIIYAELGSAFPLTGGPYSLPKLALGDTTGFVMGWGYFLYAFIGTAAILDIFITYIGFYVPGLAVAQTLTPVGIAIAVVSLWGFTAMNLVGVKWGGRFSIITTVGKIIPLVLFGLIGLTIIKVGNFTPFMQFGWTGLGLAMAFDFWAFVGFEGVVIPTEEVKNPARNIPRAMLITMATVIAVYVLISVAFTGMINWSGLGLQPGNWAGLSSLSSPLANVSSAAGLALLAGAVTLGALVSTGGAGGDWVLFQGRIPYAMAKDNLFWAPIGKINAKYGTPFRALIFASALTMVVQILIPSFPPVALLASITTLIPYAAATVSLPILRKTQPNVQRPFKLPVASLMALLGFIFSTILIYWASWPWTIVGALLTLIGFPLFLVVKSHKFEWGRSAWVWFYAIGLVIISLLGDSNFVYGNFLPIGPLGILPMPYDLLVLVTFSILIFYWAYKANTSQTQLRDFK